MAHIGLISCVSKKRSWAAQAQELYNSALFMKSRDYVKKNCDLWFILSAKYGLVDPEDIIEPYEDTLNTKSASQRLAWAKKVWEKLRSRLNPDDRITVLAGIRYREYLMPMIIEYGYKVDVPMDGLGIGRQLQWLTTHLHTNRERDVERFYKSLQKLESGLGGKRLLSECTARQGWPTRGVYLFFEPGETRKGMMEARVVRVGTHGVSRGSKATLWNRLRTHRGSVDGVGNHRGSIFRLHVGEAIASRDPLMRVPSWGIGQAAPAEVRSGEQGLERMVSAYIGAMQVLWISVLDDASPSSDRAYIERNLIGMLVGNSGPVDPPSKGWLGRFSRNARIQQSGLWNLDFLDYTYSSNFLDVLEEYINITIGAQSAHTYSIAPRGWHIRDKNGAFHSQLTLFGE